ncbi:hypothetical protein BB559_001448 [Furculomyces boomerangus]|uniref:Uncharacterized protein n=1 Tax=Furculomyces boomerangus TaxID=61424 RepID=A0A2T9Z1Y7_9FUNG|nr:hypothetical protein BB559_001448 [Furculomyces boomerangus]
MIILNNLRNRKDLRILGTFLVVLFFIWHSQYINNNNTNKDVPPKSAPKILTIQPPKKTHPDASIHTNNLLNYFLHQNNIFCPKDSVTPCRSNMISKPAIHKNISNFANQETKKLGKNPSTKKTLNQEQRDFYLKVREHVICSIIYIFAQMFWFTIFIRAQKTLRKLPEIKLNNSEKKLAENVQTNSSVNIENNQRPLKHRKSIIELYKKTNGALLAEEYSSEKILQKLPSLLSTNENRTFPISFIDPLARVNSEPKRAGMFELEFEGLSSTNNTDTQTQNEEIVGHMLKRKSVSENIGLTRRNSEKKLIFGGKVKEFYIGKAPVHKQTLVRKPSRLRNITERKNSLLKEPSISEILKSSNPPRNTEKKILKRHSIDNLKKNNDVTYNRDLNHEYLEKKILEIKSSGPFSVRVFPSLAGSIGITLVSMEIILLIVTIVMTNVMELSQITVSDEINKTTSTMFSRIGTNFTNKIKLANNINSPKVSFTNFFLPNALLSTNQDSTNSSTINLYLKMNSLDGVSSKITPYDYPGVLRRLWQYQSILVLLAIFVVYPFSWLVLKFSQNTGTIKKPKEVIESDNFEGFTGKRQRDISYLDITNLNYNSTMSISDYKPEATTSNSDYTSHSVSYLKIRWRNVVLYLVIFWAALFLVYQALSGIQRIIIPLVEKLYDYCINKNLKHESQLESKLLNDHFLPKKSFFLVRWGKNYLVDPTLQLLYSIFKSNLVYFDLQVIVLIVVFPMVLIYSPIGVLNLIRFLVFVLPLSGSAKRKVVTINTAILKFREKLEKPSENKEKKRSRWSLFEEKSLGTYFKWVSHTNLNNLLISKSSSDEKPQSGNSDPDTKNKSKGIDASDNNQSLRLDHEKDGTNNKESILLSKDSVDEIRKALNDKQEELYNSKIISRTNKNLNVFWSSPSLRNFAFLFLSGLWIFCWFVLVSQSIYGLLNAIYVESTDLRPDSGFSNSGNYTFHYRNDTHQLNGTGYVRYQQNVRLNLTNSILISVFHVIVCVSLFFITFCGFYRLYLEPGSGNIYSKIIGKCSSLGFLGAERIFKARVKQISNVEWDSLYLANILLINKKNKALIFNKKKVIKQTFVLLLLASGWPAILRTISVLSRPSYSLITQSLSGRVFPYFEQVIFGSKTSEYCMEQCDSENICFVDENCNFAEMGGFNITNGYNYILDSYYDNVNLTSVADVKQGLETAMKGVHHNFCLFYGFVLQKGFSVGKTRGYLKDIFELGALGYLAQCNPKRFNYKETSNPFIEIPNPRNSTELEKLCFSQANTKVYIYNQGYSLHYIPNLEFDSNNSGIEGNSLLLSNELGEQGTSGEEMMYVMRSAFDTAFGSISARKSTQNSFHTKLTNNAREVAIAISDFYKSPKDSYRRAIPKLGHLVSGSKNYILNFGRRVTSRIFRFLYIKKKEPSVSANEKKLSLISIPLLYEQEFWMNMNLKTKIPSKKNKNKVFDKDEALSRLLTWVEWLSFLPENTNGYWEISGNDGIRSSTGDQNKTRLQCRILDTFAMEYGGVHELFSDTKEQKSFGFYKLVTGIKGKISVRSIIRVMVYGTILVISSMVYRKYDLVEIIRAVVGYVKFPFMRAVNIKELVKGSILTATVIFGVIQIIKFGAYKTLVETINLFLDYFFKAFKVLNIFKGDTTKPTIFEPENIVEKDTFDSFIDPCYSYKANIQDFQVYETDQKRRKRR